MNTLLKFNGETVSVKFADTPRLMREIARLSELFSENSISFLLNNQTTKKNVFLYNLYCGAATFCTLIPKELTKIYFSGKDVSDLPNLLNEIISKREVFVEGSEENIISTDLILNYLKYNEEEYKVIGYNSNDFPIFRKMETEQSTLL